MLLHADAEDCAPECTCGTLLCQRLLLYAMRRKALRDGAATGGGVVWIPCVSARCACACACLLAHQSRHASREARLLMPPGHTLRLRQLQPMRRSVTRCEVRWRRSGLQPARHEAGHAFRRTRQPWHNTLRVRPVEAWTCRCVACRRLTAHCSSSPCCRGTPSRCIASL